MYKKLKLFLCVQNKQIGKRIDKVLSDLIFKCSRSKIKELILKKRVKIDNKIINKPDKKITQEKVIFVEILLDKIKKLEPQKISLDIVYEDQEILIINKPANLVVHPGFGNEDKTLLNGLLYYEPNLFHVPRAGIIHRLDKNTTGLMVIAKTIFSRNKLINDLKRRKIVREYEAIVYGLIKKNGTINKPITRHPKNRIKMIVHDKGKFAVTHYSFLENFDSYTRLRIKLETGRTHQIRVHMEYINHSILGDPIYKRNKFRLKDSKKNFSFVTKFNRQALHSAKLSLIHPVKNKNMEWKAKLPKDMFDLIEKLKNKKLNK